MELLVIEGTVRDGRRSVFAAKKITELLARSHEVELFDIRDYDIPLFRHRRYVASEPHPADIERFGRKVERADGLIFVTPEYNGTIPGALKNLIDHLYPEYYGMPVSYISVSDGRFGGVRALERLQAITLILKAHPGPSLSISFVKDVFDPEGDLVDDDYRRRFEEFASEIDSHTRQFC